MTIQLPDPPVSAAFETPRGSTTTSNKPSSRALHWLIVEDALLNRKGHWFEAVATFYAGFRRLGDAVTVLADAAVESDVRDAVKALPILPPSIWHRAGDGSGRLTRYARVFVHPWQTWKTLRSYFRTRDEFDAVFVPSVGFHHLPAWVWLIKHILRDCSTRVLLFFLMLPIRWDDRGGKAVPDGSPTSRVFFRLLKCLAPEIRSGKVVLGAEIEPIRAALESLAGVPAILFPQIVLPLEPSEPASVSGEGIEMVCCGPARAEKGSEVLQDAVRIYRRRFPQGRARFTIHWPEDFVGGSGRPVTMDPVLARDPQVTYLKRYLTHEEYETQLQKTQVVLLPYRLSAYRLRGSRVVVEAVVNGIPAIVTRGSALAGVAESHGAALTCEDGSAESLAHAIREMEERYEELKSVAAERAPAAARAFSVHSFRETFLSAGPERVQFPPGPRSATEGDRSC